jgi:hypothetical protein
VAKDVIKARPMAMIGKVLCVCVEPGTQIFDLYSGDLLGTVGDREPVINQPANTAYLSTNDYEAAKRALPAAPKTLPGLPGGKLH